MKIRDRFTGGVRGSAPLRGRGSPGSATEASRSGGAADRVQISGRSVEIQRARMTALQAPEVRQALVDEILGLIEQGQYDVEGRDVVPKMIQEQMMGAGD